MRLLALPLVDTPPEVAVSLLSALLNSFKMSFIWDSMRLRHAYCSVSV